MATYNNDDYASKGVGTAGLTLGIIGTTLASGLLNGNGLGGLFGNNTNQNPAASPVYQLSQKDNGYHWSSTIIWAKDTLVLSRKDYHTQYEPIWYGWEDSASRLKNVEDRKQSDLWQIPRPKKSELHPTTKPVELVERAINNSSNPGDVVLDLFGGSGTTIIACEQTGRFGRSMELDQKYADVIVKRFVNLKGADSVFLLKPDGTKVPYDEIAK